MIDLSQEFLSIFLLRSLLLGIVLDALYLILMLIREISDIGYRISDGKRLRVINVWTYTVTFLSDLLFFIAAAVSSILLTYGSSGGIFRGMVYIGIISGFILCHLTLGKIIKKPMKAIAHFVHRVLWKVIKLILVPVRAIFSLVFKLYDLTIGKIIGKIIEYMNSRSKEEKNTHNVADENGMSVACAREETVENAKQFARYRKEGRISFGNRS